MAQAVPLETPPLSRAQAGVVATEYPPSSIAFDWLMGAMAVLVQAGVIQDGWAHAHGKVDQSFITPWHAILYGMMGLTGIVLGSVAVRNKLRGYPVARTLPYGYWLALAGVMLFVLGGLFDLVWHTLFGIETGVEALISPSHLTLALAAALVFSGPLRSAARQYAPSTGGWARIGPVVLALTATLVLLGFFMGYAQPVEDGFTTAAIGADPSGPLVASLYSAGVNGRGESRLELPANLDIWGLSAAPDGKRITYRAQAPRSAQASGQAPSDVYVANADGTHAVRITHSGRHDTQVAWSPDGQWIAYVSMPAGTSGNFSLHTVKPDGSGDRTLVDGVTTIQNPAWSPDSKQLVYDSRNGETAMMAVVDTASRSTHWLTFTSDATQPVWTRNGLIYASGAGTIVSVGIDGSNPKTLAKKSQGTPAVSPDGRTLAYLGSESGSSQVFVAPADGSAADTPAKTHNVSQLSGMDAARAAWLDNGHVVFSATGRPSPEHSQVGSSLAEAANLLQAVLIAGVLLAGLRRFRLPVGTFSLVLTLFTLAMATQTDAYLYAAGALVTGILADVAVAVFKDKLRSGIAFYAFAFALPAVLFASYLVTTIQSSGGTSWAPNMLLGSPLLAGCAGLLVAFCFESPLPAARETKAEA